MCCLFAFITGTNVVVGQSSKTWMPGTCELFVLSWEESYLYVADYHSFYVVY